MADVPDLIVLKRDRDLAGRRHEIWIRRGLFALVAAVPVLALLNVFGQRPTDVRAGAAAATLSVHAPVRLRSGLLYESRFTIDAHDRIGNAVLVFNRGWFEGMTVNTIEPSPTDEHSVDGDPAFELGPVDAGQKHVLYVQTQINPTFVGSASHRVRLYDGDRLLATVDRDVTVFP